MEMIYLILAIIILLGSALLLNIRIRIELDKDRRLLFFGLGRSGAEYDFVSKINRLKIFGFNLKPSEPGRRTDKKPPPVKAQPPKEKPAKPKKKRERPLGDMIKIAPQCLRAAGLYLLGLVKSAAIEEFEGEIKGGFETPDLTGQAFGYYQAVLGAAPALAGRLRFYPDWTGASFAGAVKVSVVLPLYKLLYRSLVLVLRLPLRKLVKLAIGTKKGEQDV
ncbi:MAG: hypothetical protein ACOYVF_04410 [Candidatus Zixiibacteriota bacterium]